MNTPFLDHVMNVDGAPSEAYQELAELKRLAGLGESVELLVVLRAKATKDFRLCPQCRETKPWDPNTWGNVATERNRTVYACGGCYAKR